MDFLDPKKQKAHTVRLFTGYILVGIALILTTIILLYQAYGFGVDRNGNVIQNGLVFMSSTPNPAQIYMNGERYKSDTNVRMLLNSGQYTFEIKKDGYRDWKRAITVEGGSVERYDYPFLFPSKLQTSSMKTFSQSPGLATQSPDRRWLLIQPSTANIASLDLYDLNNQKDTIGTLKNLTIPSSAFTAAEGTQSWEAIQWSNNNRHVVLKHIFTKDGAQTSEYVLFDRDSPQESVNLTKQWGVNPTEVSLRDNKYDQYYLYDQAAGTLMTASIKEPTPKAYLTQVLAYKSYGENVMLYVTNKDMENGKVAVMWRDGDKKAVAIRSLPANTQYSVDLTKYDGQWYVVAAAASEGRAYVYNEPIAMIEQQDVAVPVRILKVNGVNNVSFSDNTRFIMAENGSAFAVYDAETDKGYTYDTKKVLDAPQLKAEWMDGHRIAYTSGGKLIVFDFDGANLQALMANNPVYEPFFDRDYEFVFDMAPNGNNSTQTDLFRTPLRLEDDL